MLFQILQLKSGSPPLYLSHVFEYEDRPGVPIYLCFWEDEGVLVKGAFGHYMLKPYEEKDDTDPRITGVI